MMTYGGDGITTIAAALCYSQISGLFISELGLNRVRRAAGQRSEE